MIKKLRRKFTIITTILLITILMVVLWFMYQSAKTGLENDAWDRLQEASEQFRQFTKPGRQVERDSRSCFMVHLLPDGELMAIGGASYDLDNPDELLELYEKAKHTRQEKGVLKEENLRFLRCDEWRGEAFVFTDMKSERAVLNRLSWTCLMILLLGMLVSFGVSLLLARWAVRPVERAWEQQRQFVADASHELKTPLTVILTNAELLQDEDYDAESKAGFASSILAMSRQMRGLVEELLDQARVDSNKLDQQKLDYTKLVSDAVLPFEPVYYEAGRELRCQIEPGIMTTGNAAHLYRVVEILLDNGCKYSNANDVVELQLRRQGRGSLLSVRSSGISMTEQQCKDIFKRFYRMDQARSMNRSYGLGLAIAQGIVEQHRGKIWAKSQDGYNTFYVSLPQ